jgi:hypothetical protein
VNIRRNRRVRRTRRGVELALPEEERELVGALVSQLRALLLTDDLGAGDPNLRRLFPVAYADDEQLDAEYKDLVRDSLLEGRLAALDTIEATLHAKTLDEEQLGCWMGGVNDLRLVIGTRLDVSEEDEPEIDPDDPDAPARVAYHYLGWLLEEIVTVLSAGLPETGIDD